MAHQTNAVLEHQRKTNRERHARKQVERVDRRKILGCFLAFSREAREAMQELERLDKLGVGLLLMLCSSMAYGQSILVLSDTNQLRLLPANIKVEWRTNLYTAVTDTFVTTNWMPVGQPVDLITNGVVVQRRQHEAATLLTNISHRITYDGVERVWTVSQSLGPVLATRHYDLPPPLPTTPFLAVPNRIQR